MDHCPSNPPPNPLPPPDDLPSQSTGYDLCEFDLMNLLFPLETDLDSDLDPVFDPALDPSPTSSSPFPMPLSSLLVPAPLPLDFTDTESFPSELVLAPIQTQPDRLPPHQPLPHLDQCIFAPTPTPPPAVPAAAPSTPARATAPAPTPIPPPPPAPASAPAPAAAPFTPRPVSSGYNLPFTRKAMTGGTMFESQAHHIHQHQHHSQELVTDWNPALSGISGMRRDKEMMNDNRPVPSPTYSHASGVESVASPFSHAQNAMLAGSTPVYHVPYTTNMQGSHSHLQPVPQPRFAQPPHPQQQQYYPAAGEGYDVFQTPHAQPSRQRLSPPYAESYQYEGAPHPSASLLTNSSLRTYDSTIPQYYPFTTDRTSWGQSSEVGRKRKRAPKEASPSGASTGAGAGNGTKAVKTPKRGKIPAEEAKGRARGSTQYLGEDGSGSRFQIPTPPSTGREATTVSLPVHLRIPEERESTANSTGPESVASDEPRRVLVTRHEAEGRKLAVGLAASSGSEEPLSPRGVRPQRKTPVPALTTDDAGHAMLATDLVLQSELDWLENGGKLSPITSPELVLLQTPIMPSHVIEEVADTPVTKERKTTQRLQAFVAPELPLRRADDLMVCTRLDQFGRVAVRKDLAIKFFGLDLDARGVVEEIRVEDEDQWVERSVASSSKVTIKPSWPDDVTPWSLAGGLRKERIQREETEKSNILRRYLEAASDESSDDEAPSTAVAAKGKGKSVSRLVSYTAPDAEPRRRAHRPTWDNTTADAKSALLTSMRHRALPVISPGVVACACGAPTAHGMGAMISCVSCKTWHHLMCNNIDEEAQLGGRWWCPACERQVSMSTPARSPGQGYAQSQERSSAFKGELTNIALAPSPMFNTAAFSHASTALRTPMTRNVSSPSRPHRSRILSYGTDMWAYTEDGPPGPTPSTPAPAHDRFSTPRIDDAPFDVTSTPSRHLDFNFGGGPSFFSLTPLGGRSRVTSSTLIADTPLTLRARMNGDSGSGMGMLGMGSRHDFLRDLGKESGAAAASATAIPGSPQQARWAHGLLGSQNLSPSPFGHRRSLSGNKMSSVRSSSRSGLGLGLPLERDGQDEE